MITSFISPECAAFLCEGNIIFSIKDELNAALSVAGYKPWKETEAEFFELNGKTLIIARPLSPLIHRVKSNSPRLFRF